jgi:CHAT domain-containing protein
MVHVSRAEVLRCIAKYLGVLWVFAATLCFSTGVLATVAVPCDPLVSAESTSFSLQLSGGSRVTRDIVIPAHSEALVTASETGLDVTVEATSAGRVIGRTASPVPRTGIARLMLRTDPSAKVSLAVTAKGDPGVRGLAVIRTFFVSKAAANAVCWRVQRLLAAADGHYAQAQAATIDNGGDSNTDARREYQTAEDQYLAAVKQTAAPALQAYIEYALAELLDDWLLDWNGARLWAHTAARTYRREGDPYGAARARAIEAEASMEIALRSPATGVEGIQRTATELRRARAELRSLATFHAGRGESFDRAQALNHVGVSFFYEGLDDKAIGAFRDALSIFERLGEGNRKRDMLQDIAVSEADRGHVYDAVAQYTRLLQVMLGSADLKDRASVLNNSAVANRMAGHMDVALQQYADALQLARQAQDNLEQAGGLYGFGTVYDTLGDSDRALDFYRQSLSLMSAEVNIRGRVALLRRTASVLRSRGQVQEALSMHDEALSLAKTVTQRTLIQIQRAGDLEALGQSHSALQLLESVIQERNSGPKVVQAQALLERAKIRISTGELSAAAADLQSAIATFAAEDSPVDAFSAWTALAQAQYKRGSTQQALDSLGHALKLAEEVRLQTANPELRASLLQPLRPAFDLKIALLTQAYFASGDAKDASAQEQSALEALSTAEQARARAFEDFERLDVGRSATQAHLLEQRRDVYRELAARHFQLESDRERMADNDVRVRALRSDISELRVKLDETEMQINAGASTARAKTSSEGWVFDRRRLPADTAIVEYWLGDPNAIAWVATRDRLTLVDLGASAQITDAARAFHDSLGAFGKAPTSKRLEDSAHLYALTIQPLERYIAPYHTLIFAPDGALHYIPFAALRATGQPRFLIENHDVALTPSVRILLNRSPEATVPHLRAERLLLVADPVYTADDDRLRSTAASRNTDSKETDLRSMVFRSSSGALLPRLIYTAREADAVASLFAPDQIDRLEGFTATKDRFLAAPFDRYRVIHVASHSMIDAQILGLSALALSAFAPSGKKIDNLVFAADFLPLRLNADLVVLSACDTALGKNVAGEGLMGLRYIVLARGAGAVVASLWEVPDEATSNLMTAFYRSFLSGHKSITAALSEAMRTMVRKSNADPSEWGSFTATISAPAYR